MEHIKESIMYNMSTREYDVVTLERNKKLDQVFQKELIIGNCQQSRVGGPYKTKSKD
jgi:hypothetical protein